MTSYDYIVDQLLCMNSTGSINNDIAERQKKVAALGFGHFYEGNNFLYIADEVGLGKTYIALAIASMLRHFSPDPEQHTDFILVPKKNLQEKWEKEIYQFVQNNYILQDNIVRSAINYPIGKIIKHNSLDIPGYGAPFYHIFRNTSFSIGSSESESDSEDKYEDPWALRLKERLPAKEQALFKKASSVFKGPQKAVLLKKTFAYLLNATLKPIDLLIIDEAHNFKHGISRHSSTRNMLVPRVYGAIYPGNKNIVNAEEKIFDENDDLIFELMPELQETVGPKVNKLLLLSATPMDKGLHEVKNQLDCFLPEHKFSKYSQQDCIDKMPEQLSSFMIRGIMNMTLGNKTLSRNMYRHEHRKGNVNKNPDSEPLYIKNNKDSIILGLVQYKTIEKLNKKEGSFELGLLSGFESFARDNEFERETILDRNERETADADIIRMLSDSYIDTMGSDLPHPKQDRLIDELLEMMKRGEKALVFVRRIGSTRELERKLVTKFTDYLMQFVKKIPNPSPALTSFMSEYDNASLLESVKRVLSEVGIRISSRRQELIKKINEVVTQREINNSLFLNDLPHDFTDDLITTYLNKEAQYTKDFIAICTRYAQNKRYQRIEHSFVDIAISCLASFYCEQDFEDDSFNAAEIDTEEQLSDFLNIFFKRSGYKDRLYKQAWFFPNMYLLHECFSIFDVNYKRLEKSILDDTKATQLKRLNEIQKEIEYAILKEAPSNLEHKHLVHDDFKMTTFFTTLLTKICHTEIIQWLDSPFISPLKSLDREVELYLEIQRLCNILRSIFIHGSGLLPVFVADKQEGDFTENLCNLLTNDFQFVLEEIRTILRDYQQIVTKNFSSRENISKMLTQRSPVFGVSGFHKRNVSKVATQFRMPGYPYVVIATDILKEGEDLHTYCANIFHYGIAWNPSDMEQRTGRIDRIGSWCSRNLANLTLNAAEDIPFEQRLQVFFPYLADTLEVNQLHRLFTELNNFIETFYTGMVQSNNTSNARAFVNAECTKMPQQNRELLLSHYDYTSFTGCNNGPVDLNIKPIIGLTKDSLLERMFNLKNLLTDLPHEGNIRLEKHVPRLVGALLVNNNRRAQYAVYVKPLPVLGFFEFYISVNVCVNNPTTDKKIITKIINELQSDRSYQCRTHENILLVEKNLKSLDIKDAITELESLAILADRKEMENFGNEDNDVEMP